MLEYTYNKNIPIFNKVILINNTEFMKLLE